MMAAFDSMAACAQDPDSTPSWRTRVLLANYVYPPMGRKGRPCIDRDKKMEIDIGTDLTVLYGSVSAPCMEAYFM